MPGIVSCDPRLVLYTLQFSYNGGSIWDLCCPYIIHYWRTTLSWICLGKWLQKNSDHASTHGLIFLVWRVMRAVRGRYLSKLVKAISSPPDDGQINERGGLIMAVQSCVQFKCSRFIPVPLSVAQVGNDLCCLQRLGLGGTEIQVRWHH